MVVCNSPVSLRGDSWLEMIWFMSALLFIMALRGLSKQETATWGNIYGIIGMFIAIAGSWASPWVCGRGYWIIAVSMAPGAAIGIGMASMVTMIQMPQMVGLLNAFGGLAAALEGIALYMDPEAAYGPNGIPSGSSLYPDDQSAEVVIQSTAMYFSVVLGSLTFFGSLVACAKLQGLLSTKPRIPPLRLPFTLLLIGGIVATCVLADQTSLGFGYGTIGGLGLIVAAFVLSGILGLVFTLAIGGADMPVVICVLNTGSGFSGAFAGFMLANKLLVITGAFVGVSGAILSVIMCNAMNRSLYNVLVGGFGDTGKTAKAVEGEMTEIEVDGVAELVSQAKEVIIVPGYGMAAAGAQHAVAQVVETMRKRGTQVRFAIHPVAGRLPGHMNVLLAEARVPYDIVLEMDEINNDFSHTDVVMVVGANDTVNPAALEDPDCAIAGMPVCRVWEAKNTIVIKRGRGGGYSGVDNPLFVRENNQMFFGNAKDRMEQLQGKLQAMGDTKVGTMPALGNKQEKAHTEEKPETFPEGTLTLGVLTETFPREARVSMAAPVAKKFRLAGYNVIVQSGAGVGSGFSDAVFRDNGCEIASSASEVIQASDVIFTVRPVDDSSLALMKGKTVVSWIGRLTPEGKAWTEKAASCGVNAIDVTSFPRITTAQKLDCLSSQAKLAGHRAVLEAANRFQRFLAPEITAAGKYPPCHVMVLGAGVAGLSAIGTAVSLGCDVRAWDVRDISDQVESMGAKWFTVDFKEEGAGEGGYAKEGSEAFKNAQKATFHRHAKECDIIITTAAIPGRPSPVLIEDWMVADMKPGSVIVDLGAEGGGNCTMTKKEQTFETPNGVTIIGYTDMPSRMGNQASLMYGQNMFNLMSHIQTIEADNSKTLQVIDSNLDDTKHEGVDVILNCSVCVYDSKVRNPPPPPMPSAPKPKQNGSVQDLNRKPAAPTMWDKLWRLMSTSQFILLLTAGIAACFAVWAPRIFLEQIIVFMLAGWVGYMLVWNVQPAFHTPLMSVSNAISGVVIIGGIFMVSAEAVPTVALSAVAIFIAAINAFGGFTVTQRMLAMFKRG